MCIKRQILKLTCLDLNLGSAINAIALGKLHIFSVLVFFTCKVGVIIVPTLHTVIL